MAYYDLVNMDAPDRKTASILGFKKIFSKKELPVVDNLGYTGRCILASGEAGMLGRGLRRNNVTGIMINDSELIRMAVEEVVDTEKILVLPVHGITCGETRARLRNIYRMRGLMATATRSKAKIALVTMAEDESCMLSALQMVEVAKFIGATEAQAKKMVGAIGELE
ncbi:MAG TPA: hypothetical protein VL945_01090 [Candidatus Saccharimonadales bacterium]|nr:hypothetical protein [Candidatus Saccharimonadales bacterium]